MICSERTAFVLSFMGLKSHASTCAWLKPCASTAGLKPTNLSKQECRRERLLHPKQLSGISCQSTSSSFISLTSHVSTYSYSFGYGGWVSGGMAAPPTIEKHRKPEVASSDAVERSSVIVKITGNMIELNSPIDSAA